MEETKGTNLIDVAGVVFNQDYLLNKVIRNYIKADAPGINDMKANWDMQERWDIIAQACDKLKELKQKFEKAAAVFDEDDLNFFDILGEDLCELKESYLDLAERAGGMDDKMKPIINRNRLSSME